MGLDTQVNAINMAVGSIKSELMFTDNLDTVNHIATKYDSKQNQIKVAVDTLDSILNGLKPTVLKIDVEGFEAEVIRGAASTLSSQNLEAIIIEFNGSGTQYGFDEEKIHSEIMQYGFSPFSYFPLKRELKVFNENTFKFNRIYIRDSTKAYSRLKSSKPFKVKNSRI